jgi:ribosome biogenesis protein ERB1
MTAAGPKKQHMKRKQVDDEILEPGAFAEAVDLEMLSDEEDEVGVSGSDDGEVDEFPEIDTRSDSEDGEYEGSEDSGDEEGDQESSTTSDADSDLHIFPESKTIISGITGQPKRVYPEIEPDYDSDSSTEDVWCPFWRLREVLNIFNSLPIVLAMYRCIGMTTCLMWGMT